MKRRIRFLAHLIGVVLVTMSLACSNASQSKKETVVYQLNIQDGDAVGRAVVSSLDSEFAKSNRYSWVGFTSHRIFTKIGITTIKMDQNSIIGIAVVGVNKQDEPLIIRQYMRVVRKTDDPSNVAREMFNDFDESVERSRGVE